MRDDDNLADELARIDDQLRTLERSVHEMHERQCTGRSGDRLVTVTVVGNGRLAGLDIAAEALREHDHESLATAVVQAWAAATTDAARQLADDCPEVFGALAPTDDDAGAPGAPRPAPTAPAITAWEVAGPG
ncbi:MAG: YbaB/EbfC family nucleoid-associated protein [Phycicoccus sp.]